MPNKQITLDSSTDSQSIDQPGRRTIYDAGLSEIFIKSFVAGIGLGIGRVITTLLFFGIIAGIFVTYLEPWLIGLTARLESTIPSFLRPVQPSESTRFQYSDEQFLDIFSSFRPAPAQESLQEQPTSTTETTTP